ncbi:hypothetical protein Ngar_c04220 [Candidatus Nitrososphaera gargensis Ga9.2]|uniref:Uncharacterized protein n=1 Tax=Nitrososphaera gargensis (strain Ga9.2) TaxID=1237085 RepID=K0ILU8_NITGG|nr:hypothetical protein [Candidatus Nitrososphaera gargensis]AFU57369.1 hypothetical protein Ngar_c04220 [Candidatus Nitrososphaera gargensis Ga9.2]
MMRTGEQDRKRSKNASDVTFPAAVFAILIAALVLLLPAISVYAQTVSNEEHADGEQTMTATEQQHEEAGGEHEKADWVGPVIAGAMIATSTITYETLKRRAIREEEKKKGSTAGKEKDKSQHGAA